MPIELISCGVPQAILQNVVWALPASRHELIAKDVCEFSVDNSTWVRATTSTTGMTSAWAFVRCTTGNTIVSCKKS